MSNDTSRRAEANRRNARKSTGPRTAAGKERSRFNAVKHGLSAKVEVLPGEDGDAFRARLEAWTANLQPRDEIERYLVERAVHVSWQLDRADRAQAARVADARYAGSVKTGDIADEVAAMGRRLFWDPRGPDCLHSQADTASLGPARPFWSMEIDDPNDPTRLVNRLEGSALGCAWLLDGWAELRTVLEEGRKWQPCDRFRAVRLLGKQPLDAADDRQVMSIYLACHAMDPDGPHPFADVTSGLLERERQRFLEHLDARGAMSRIPADAEAGKVAMLELIADEEARLEELLAIHLEREQAAGEQLGFDDSDSGEWLRRYQLTFNRTLLRLLETLRKRRRETGGASDRGPAGIRPVDPVVRRSPDPTLGVTEDFASVRRGSADPAIRPTQGLSDLAMSGSSVLVPPAAEKENPSRDQVSKNEPTEFPGRPGQVGKSTGATARNSQNEPNSPAKPNGRRPSEGLAALFGLLGLVLAAVFTPTMAVQSRAGWMIAVPSTPVLREGGGVGRLIPYSIPSSEQPTLICSRLVPMPNSDRGRSSPS